jgi:hypothetical protein
MTGLHQRIATQHGIPTWLAQHLEPQIIVMRLHVLHFLKDAIALKGRHTTRDNTPRLPLRMNLNRLYHP